jgi:hypothetical protein
MAAKLKRSARAKTKTGRTAQCGRSKRGHESLDVLPADSRARIKIVELSTKAELADALQKALVKYKHEPTTASDWSLVVFPGIKRLAVKRARAEARERSLRIDVSNEAAVTDASGVWLAIRKESVARICSKKNCLWPRIVRHAAQYAGIPVPPRDAAGQDPETGSYKKFRLLARPRPTQLALVLIVEALRWQRELWRRRENWLKEQAQHMDRPVDEPSIIQPKEKPAVKPPNPAHESERWTELAPWLRDRLRERGWSPLDLEKHGGPEHRTTQRALLGWKVREDVRLKIARGLSAARKFPEIVLTDVPSS